MPNPATGLAYQYLQLCLRARLHPAALAAARTLTAQAEFDWEAVAEAARENVVLPLLSHVLRDEPGIPASLRQKFRGAYTYTARRNRALLAELAQVLKALEEAGIPALVLKGAALAATVYPDPGLRPIRDLDLLIEPGRLADALQALEPFGYAPVNAEVRGHEVISFGGEIALRKSDVVETLLELHAEPLRPAVGGRAIPAGWFWVTAGPLEIGGVQSKMLGLEAQIVYLAAHAWQHHRQGGLLWLHDLAEVLGRDSERVAWEQTLEFILQHDLTPPVEQMLARLVEGWGAPVPASVLERLRAANRTDPNRQAAPAANGPGRGWAGRARDLWHLALPPADYIQRRYHVAYPALVPLYYPLRWLEAIREALFPR